MTGAAVATTPDGARTRRARPGRVRLWVAIAVILAALGFLVMRGLGDATVYFKTADEAVDEKASLGARRFRLEGVVLAGTVTETDSGVDFRVTGERETVDVRHRGDPPELFQPGIPVVLEGQWDGAHFASDRIMVKHSSEYRQENPERVKDYTGTGPSPGAGTPTAGGGSP